MNVNGLYLQKGASQVFGISAIEHVETIFEQFKSPSGQFVLWLDHQVLTGQYEHHQFFCPESYSLDLTYLQRLRLFDSKQELHIWRSQNQLKGRLRQDTEGQPTEFVVAEQILVGTDYQSLGEFTEIFEERGTLLRLPLPNIHVDEQQARSYIQTHHYIDYNSLGQAGYVDCRFVAFGTQSGG